VDLMTWHPARVHLLTNTALLFKNCDTNFHEL